MLDMRVFGELRLEGPDAVLPPSQRARALLGWLAVHPGRHSRSRLAGLFWPDVRETSARASLRSALWALRPALGPVLVADRETVALGDDLRVDLWEFRRLLAAGDTEAALALAADELLRDLDDDWVIEARADLDRQIENALADLTGRARAAGDRAAELGWARRWAARAPLAETAGQALIRALVEAGDEAAAAEAYRRLKDGLRDELGIKISATITALVGSLVATPAGGARGQQIRQATTRQATTRQATTRQATTRQAQTRQGQTRHVRQARQRDRLIGRGQQYAALASAWRRARAGTGGILLVEGEGGIGKTRLVQELRNRIEDEALTAAAGVTAGSQAPFGVWTDALTDLLAAIGQPWPDADEPAVPRWAAELAAIVPALAYVDVAEQAYARGDPRLDQVRLCEAVVQFLGLAVRRAPVLIALEDLHAADNASLELIAYAGRRLRRMPVLLILTRRELPARAQLDAVLAALRSSGALSAEIRLGPLDATAGRELIDATADLPERTISRIIQLSGGNPLLTVEAARAAGSRVEPDLAGVDLSATTRKALGTLPVPARLFAEFAAVAGRDLDRAEVAALPLPNPARQAAEALGCGLLRIAGSRTGYRHALLREAVYEGIPDPLRAKLHGEFAAMLRRRGIPGSRPPAAEISGHLLLAGQDSQAVGQLALAARDARAVAALAEAAGFLAEAIRIVPDDAELSVELAEVEAFRGLLASSDQAFERALERIAPDDSGALVSAWLRRGRWLRGGICHPRESRRCYRNALDVLDRDSEEDMPARAEALAGLAWAEATGGDRDAVDLLLAEADRILGAWPDDLLAHDIGTARAHALLRSGRFTACYGPLVAAANAAGRAGRPDMAYSCLANAACAAASAGEFGRALDFADRALSLATPNGLLRLCVYAQVARSAILRRLGRMAEAGHACEAAAGYASLIGLAELDGLVHGERGLLSLASADPAAAAAELTEALRLGAPVSRAATRLRVAEALAASGQPGQAEAELRAAVLEPVSAADFPATLVAAMSRVQGLIAAARGDLLLAERRFTESAAAWQRIVESLDRRLAGAGYVAALIDFGRPPVTALVEPAAELAVVRGELAAIRR